MINIKDEKIKEIVETIHDGMKRKIKRGKDNHSEIILENRILEVICQDFDCGPSKCAKELNEKYDYNLTGNQVITVFRNRRMANPIERKQLLQWADVVADFFGEAIKGDKAAYENFEKKRKEVAVPGSKRHDSQERIAAIMIFQKFPELDIYDDAQNLQSFGNAVAKYFFYDMADAIAAAYGYPLYKENQNNINKDKKKTEITQGKKLSYEELLKKNELLENNLDRTTMMLQELQDEFDEMIEASKAKELAEFFSRLNSEKYGYILDELLAVRKGIDELRKNGFEIPVEINGLLIMVKKLIQFVKDSHIDPMMKLNSTKLVKAADVEFCDYEGTPFANADDEKMVRVISPGWIYRDKEIQISRPSVKEEE